MERQITKDLVCHISWDLEIFLVVSGDPLYTFKWDFQN